MELTAEEIAKFRLFMKEHVKISIYDATKHCRVGDDCTPEIGVSLLLDDEEISSCTEYLPE